MKTRYLAEAQLGVLDLNKALTNSNFLDVVNGTYYVGLLSSLPLEGKDGWEGAAEIFSQAPTIFLPGIKDPSITAGSYQPVLIQKNNFIAPTLVNTSLGLSGILTEYRAPIQFPVATANWGIIRGVVVYTARETRIIPLFSIPFVSTTSVNTNDQLTILNSPDTRMRAIELIKKNTV